MAMEKLAAFAESWSAMQLELFRANMKLLLSPVLWSMPWPGPRRPTRRAAPDLQRTLLAILSSGAAPIHRRVVGNARRLRRVRIR